MRISLLKEILIVSGLGWASFRQRWRRSLTTLIGTIGVVTVFVSVISIAQGYHNVVKITEGTNNIMVMMSGASSELISTLSPDQANLIKQSALLEQNAAQQPMVSAEVFTTVKIDKLGTRKERSISMRGVEATGFDLHKVEIVAGHSFTPGRREVIIGRRVFNQINDLKIGDELRLGSANWTLVGVFEVGGGLLESELWTDAATLQQVRQQGNNTSVMYLRLAPDVDVKSFESKLAEDPRTNVNVGTETEYLSSQSSSFTKFVEAIGYATTILMGMGAIFAALNTSHATVAQRTRELATLKALGFQDISILAAVLLESTALSMAGGLLAALLSYWVFDGFTVATILGSHNYSAVVFSFNVSTPLMLSAIGVAACIGLIGALYPSITILHLPVAKALARRN
jgi:putative ABC transport system permease protein